MSEENKNYEIKLHMCESYVTYTNKGEVNIDIRYFPELEGKTKQEVATWVTENAHKLYINYYGWILPTEKVTTQEFILNNGFEDLTGKELEDALKDENWNGEEEAEDDRVPLWNHFEESGVIFDKIKNEEHYFTAD
jgi:hypothetical protein